MPKTKFDVDFRSFFGITPVNLLKHNNNFSKLISFPISFGISPVKLLLAIFGCGIVSEDGSPREPEHLVIAEKVDDTFVSVAELAAMTFIEDENDAFIA